jgi:Uma2 family endonuclease
MPSPLKRPHGSRHGNLIVWLGTYQHETPGTEFFDNATTILGEEAEPQPDGCLLISAPGHGQTREENDYIAGPPELMAEVAAGSEAIDLHLKRDDYERAGVQEYVVVLLRQQRVIWYRRRGNRFEELVPGADGIYRSEVFPGLWLDATALLRNDGRQVTTVLRQGLASPEHAAFVVRLATPPAADAPKA